MTGNSDCTSFVCDGFGVLITALQLGQFIPQHLEMAIDKSAAGISPWLLFFCSLCSHLAALDIVMTSGVDLLTCDASPYRCFIRAQPLLQMVGSAFLSATMWYWFLKYHHDSEDSMDENELALRSNFFYSLFSAHHFFYLFVLLAAISSIGGAYMVLYLGVKSPIARSFGQSCGLMSAVLNAVMWIPQIAVTYIYRHKGALSVGWVFSTIVMDVVYSVYMAGVGVDFSVWANNIPDGFQTSLLLIMILYFEYQDDVQGLDYFGRAVNLGDDDEQLPLRSKSTQKIVPAYEAI